VQVELLQAHRAQRRRVCCAAFNSPSTVASAGLRQQRIKINNIGRFGMNETDTVLVEYEGPVTIVSINRLERKNAVDGATARRLFDAFRAFDADPNSSVAVFTGTGGGFCAGADLKAVAIGDREKKRELGGHDSIAPMG
jgi:hypothetical protein